jgi:hypothetical protein
MCVCVLCQFEHPNPFFDEEQAAEGSGPAAFAYRYRKWNLSEGIDLVCMCVCVGSVVTQSVKFSSLLSM